MKGNNFNEENDLKTAKEMLDNILSPLNNDEKKRILKLLLDLTELM